MKKFTFMILAVLFLQTVYAQIFESVDTNNIQLTVEADGFFPFNPTDNLPALIVPKYWPKEESPSGTLFSGSLWIAGLNSAGDLHVACNTYKQVGQDFWSGPIADDYTSTEYLDKYNRVFLVGKEVIDDHILHFEEVGYIVPDDLLSWPGNGNVANGEAEQLAPYFDFNANELYDPANGDYPIIRGDEAAFVIFNDAKEVHTETGGDAFGIEIHAMIYAYDDEENQDLWNTTFVHYEIINRSTSNYSEVYIGFFADFDIGCYSDDYVGCDTTTNLFYGYNANEVDDPCSGNYEEIIPAQGVMFLNEKMKGFMYYNNDFTLTGNPTLPQEYNQYLKSIWLDETPVTYGDSGYGGTDAFPFMFPDQPGDVDGWNMVNESFLPADRRGLGTIGPLILQVNQSICLDMALPFAITDSIEDAGLTFTYHGDAVTELIKRAENIQEFYNATFSDCAIEIILNEDSVVDTTSLFPDILLKDLYAFPNPVSTVLNIQLPSIDNEVEIFIYNAIGELYRKEFVYSLMIEIDVSHFPSGVYQYEIMENNKLKYVQSFFKE